MMKSGIRKQMEQREALSDEDFVAQVTVPEGTTLAAIALRNEMARLCKVPSEALRPSDRQHDLQRLIGEWDLVQFVMVVEETLQCELPEDKELPYPFDLRCLWWKRRGPDTFGEWVEQMAEWANKTLEHICA